MKLIYSPYYASRPWVDLKSRGGILFDGKSVGTSGLLDELELRLGLQGEYPSGAERLVAYAKAMAKAISKDPKLFFAESFGPDELGTARVILSWRDALKMALWDGSVADTERLRGMAAVEPWFDAPGAPDRWLSVIAEIRRGKAFLPSLELEVRVPLESLPMAVQTAITLLPGVGAKLVLAPDCAPSAPEGTALRRVQEFLRGAKPARDEKLPRDGSLLVLEPTYAVDAFRMVAGGIEPKDGTVLVVDSPMRLNDNLTALDRPRVSASASGVPQTEQIFLLGISLFRSPVDINALTSFLRVPANPLGRLHVRHEKKDGTPWWRSLNRELLDSILSNAGLEEWEKIIGEALYDFEGNTVPESERNTILSRVGMWEKTSPDGDIPVDDLAAWLENMRIWAGGRAVLSDDGGLSALASCCAALGSLIDGRTGTLPRGSVAKWAAALLEEVTMESTRAEVGSFPTLDDIRGLVDSPEEVIWLGCAGTGETPYPYDFLSEGEKALVRVPTKEAASAFAHRALASAIASVRKRLTLVTWDIIDGAPAGEHPLMVELRAKAALPEAEEGDIPQVPEMPSCGLDPAEKTAELKVDPEVFKGLGTPKAQGGLKRDCESASSLDTLISYPFDYVMKYILGMKDYGEAELQDVTTVRGTVAHLYVSRLIDLGAKDTSLMKQIHARDFEPMLLECAKDEGAALLLPENGLLFSGFKRTLKASVDALIALLERDSLTIEGTEVELTADLPVIGASYAKVDLLTRNASGDWVIIDMKWNEGSWYYDKMEKGNILQLAFYREVVRKALGGRVAGMGYWVFPKHQLTTTEGAGFTPDADVVAYPDSGRDVFAEICASYKYRMDQLKKGIIEEGEGLEVAQMVYRADQEALGLYPLSEYRGLKSVAYGCTYMTLKGGLV